MDDWQAVLSFWFDQATPKQWWQKDPLFDGQIREQFGILHQAAARCELAHWREFPQGRLAEIIVLDQFSRNIWRDSPLAYTCDPLALALAQEAVRSGADLCVTAPQRAFFYMPYMHSESALIHRQALVLFDQPGLELNLRSERQHLAIIERFGRYPHRNRILGRSSTPEERHFLGHPGSTF